jgi:hypothetical protein
MSKIFPEFFPDNRHPEKILGAGMGSKNVSPGGDRRAKVDIVSKMFPEIFVNGLSARPPRKPYIKCHI